MRDYVSAVVQLEQTPEQTQRDVAIALVELIAQLESDAGRCDVVVDR